MTTLAKRSERHEVTIPELARMGGGEVAYIKILTPDEAERLYPQAEGIDTDHVLTEVLKKVSEKGEGAKVA